MKFIELTYSDDTKTKINFAHVVCYEPSVGHEGLTSVIIVGLAQDILVKETPHHITLSLA